MSKQLLYILLLLVATVGVMGEAVINVPTSTTVLNGNVLFNVSTTGNNTFNMTITNSTGFSLCWSTNGASNSTTRNCTVDTTATSIRDGTAVVLSARVYNETGTNRWEANNSYEVDNTAPTSSLLVNGDALKAGKGVVSYDCSASTDAVDSSLGFLTSISHLDNLVLAIQNVTTSRGDFDVASTGSAGQYNISCRVTDNAGLTNIASTVISANSPRGASIAVGQLVQQQTTRNNTLLYGIIAGGFLIIMFVVFAVALGTI